MNEAKYVGEQIRKFRILKGVTQLDLEQKINASSGSLSKIEIGKTNPSKETLQKIVTILGLNDYEAGKLFDINNKEIPEFLEISSELSKKFDSYEIMQNSVNKIISTLNVMGASIYIYENGVLSLKTVSQSWYSKALLKLFPFDFTNIKISVTKHRTNLVARTYNEGREFMTDSLAEVLYPPYKIPILNRIQKVLKITFLVSFPIKYDEKVIGALVIGYDVYNKEHIDYEFPLLRSFTELTANLVVNALNYEKMVAEFEILKKKLSQ